MLVLEIAHSHAACDIVGNPVFKQLNVRNIFHLSKEVFYFAFGCCEIAIRAKSPHVFGDDVVISEAHINGAVFFGNELQEFHVSEVVVRDIARDATRVRR